MLAIVLLFAQDLGAPFVEASAEARPVTGGLEVELQVTLNADVDTVVAHIVTPGQDQQTVALASRGGGEYGGVLIVPAEDVVVIFEAVDVGRQVLSQPATLTELGVDPDQFRGDRSFAAPDAPGSSIPQEARRWGWAAVALGATSLALIAFWAAGARRSGEETPEPAGD